MMGSPTEGHRMGHGFHKTQGGAPFCFLSRSRSGRRAQCSQGPGHRAPSQVCAGG